MQSDFPWQPLLIKCGVIVVLITVAIEFIPEKQVDNTPIPIADLPTRGGGQWSIQTQLNDGQQGRAYLGHYQQNGSELEQLVQKADQFQSQGLTDDAYLLYFKAAQLGHVGAMLKLAEQADPIYFDANKSAFLSADMVQAYKWYQQAVELGNQIAVERLNHLKDYVQELAEAGDEKAQLFSLQWRNE